jgi:hypothetical protein
MSAALGPPVRLRWSGGLPLPRLRWPSGASRCLGPTGQPPTTRRKPFSNPRRTSSGCFCLICCLDVTTSVARGWILGEHRIAMARDAQKGGRADGHTTTLSMRTGQRVVGGDVVGRKAIAMGVLRRPQKRRDLVRTHDVLPGLWLPARTRRCPQVGNNTCHATENSRIGLLALSSLIV